MGEWTDFGTRIFNETLRWVEGFGHAEKPIDCHRTPLIPYDFSPYTMEQTIRMTYNTKPKRRDPARKFNRR